MFRLLVDYIYDEDGQTSTEYILLVAVVAMSVRKFKDTLNTKLNDVIGNVFDKVDSELTNLD